MGKSEVTIRLKNLDLRDSHASIAKTVLGEEPGLMPAVHVYEQKIGHVKAHTLRSTDAELIRRLTYVKGRHLRAFVLALSAFAERNDAYNYNRGLRLALSWGGSEERICAFHARMKTGKHADAAVHSILTLTPV